LLKLLEDGTPDAKMQAATAISNLAVNDDNKVSLMKLGAGPTLLKLLEDGTLDAKMQAASAISNLVVNNDNQATLMKQGAGLKLLKLLDEGTPDAKERAANAINNLACNDVNKVSLMKLGAGPTLLKLLEEGTPDAKAEAARAISNLAVNDDNKVTLMKLGAATTLLKLLEEGVPDAKMQAVGASGCGGCTGRCPPQQQPSAARPSHKRPNAPEPKDGSSARSSGDGRGGGSDGHSGNKRGLKMMYFPHSWNGLSYQGFLQKVESLLQKFGDLESSPTIEETDEGKVVWATYDDPAKAPDAAQKLNGVDNRTETQKQQANNGPPAKNQQFFVEVFDASANWT
jgi:hypothetical protein